MPTLRPALLACALGALTVVLPGRAPAAAQEADRADGGGTLPASAGSRYLVAGHPAYEAVERLRVRGHLPALDPLVRPYRRLDLARAVEALDPDALPGPEAGWARLLREELAPERSRLDGGDPDPWGFQLAGGASASTTRRVDPLFPLRGEEFRLRARAWPWYAGGFWAEAGPWAADVRLLHDLRKEEGDDGDPDGRDPDGLIVGDRTDQAYLTFAWGSGEAFFGRMRRDWAAPGSHGLLLSDSATSWPQVGIEVRRGGFAWRFVHGELESLEDRLGRLRKRYVVVHRLSWGRDALHLALTGGTVYAARPGGGPDLRFLDPLRPLFHDGVGAADEPIANGGASIQAWYGPGAWAVHGELFLDGRGGDRWAGEVGIRVPGLAARVEPRAVYRRVAAGTWRGGDPSAVWAYLDRGLGGATSDYDRLSLIADLFPPVEGLRLSPAVHLQRSGEGSFRTPPPGGEEGGIFLGTTERIVRVALAGRWQPARWLFVEWDAGRNFVRSADHVAGDDRGEFGAVARLGVRFDLPGGRLR